MIIIFLIFVGYMHFMAPKPEPPATTTTTPQDTMEVTSRMPDRPSEQEARVDSTMTEMAPIESSDSLLNRFKNIPEEIITVENDKFIAQFTNRGGGLTSLKFKEYFYHNGDTSMVEMVPPWAESVLNFEFPDAGGDEFSISKITFSPNKTSLSIAGGSKDVLELRADLSDHDYIILSYEFYGDRYDFSVKLDFEGAANYDLGRSYLFGWSEGLESTEKNRQDDFNSFKAYAFWESGLENYKKFKHGQLAEQIEGSAKWIGTRTKYFFVGIDPERDTRGIIIKGKEIKPNNKLGEPGMKKISMYLDMPIHERKASLFDKYSVYIGPMDYDILKSYNNGYSSVVDLGGLLKPIALFILWLMKNLFSFLHNYGFVIIVFSILMKVVFYPLTARSLKSMKRMQELQPKLRALQEKYKADPQKMNAEVMKMWKENKVNPISSCLPMIPQLPIFFALFTVFRNTIVLRGSEFMFWMKDLSQPDATLILPIIMGLTMFIQQKLTMQDPKQKMLIYILPVVFFFLFKGFSTGLVLYWTMFNILSVAETILIRKPQKNKDAVVTT